MKLLARDPALDVSAALAIAALLVAGCASDSPRPPSPPTSAIPETRSFAVDNFTAVHLAAHYDMVVNEGTPASVRAQGDPAALNLLDIRTEGDTLIASVQPNARWPANANVTVTVTTPTIAAVELSGSGDMSVGSTGAESLSIEQRGSGRIEVSELAATDLRVSLSGSGDIRVRGSADGADIRLNGSGEADLGTLAVKRAEVSISGSGALTIEASETVTGTISGSGDIAVTGGATCSVSSTGSGNATCS